MKIDMDILAIVSGVISLIALIVFFFMASHIYKLLVEVREMRNILVIQAEMSGAIKISEVTCSNCKQTFSTYEEAEVICPNCTQVNQIVKQE